MYAVVLHFDAETEQTLKRVWEEFRDSGISNYVDEVPGRRPHITMADYADLDSEKFMELFDRVYDTKPGFSLNLCTLGTFIRSGTLFLAPSASMELIEFHANHYDRFSRYANEANPMYAPGAWVPHCTIASRLSETKLSEALRYCTGRLPVLRAGVQEASFMKLEYQNDQCVDTRVLLAKAWK